MTRRAEVWRNGVRGWNYLVTGGPRKSRRYPISESEWPSDMENDGDRLLSYPTHADALHAALAEVGLGTPGHITHVESAGDGYHEPLEEWCECSCGEFIWGWIQTAEGSGISGEHDDPWDAWSAHLTEVGLASNNDKKEKS